jgi:hypothetical protein
MEFLSEWPHPRLISSSSKPTSPAHWKTAISYPSYSRLPILLASAAGLPSPSLLPDYLFNIYSRSVLQTSETKMDHKGEREGVAVEKEDLDTNQRNTLRAYCDYFFIDGRSVEGICVK